jgi:hypothetical protein
MGSLNKIMPDEKITMGSKVALGIKDWWDKTVTALRA